MVFGIENVARAFMQRSRRGLYAGKEIRFGNKVSEQGDNKSRRTWKPNVHWKRVYSLALGQMIRLRMTTSAMRCIDKAGGIDEYLLNTPDHKLRSDVGVKWRTEIASAIAAMEKKHGEACTEIRENQKSEEAAEAHGEEEQPAEDILKNDASMR
eukprot:TRINITY_DN23912_c0_g1_i1.p1 TRINITY_DN23912_c0_g1~~TRINITY_DN23912_c0_g1_i1.p1  ORF type:complete len:154 (-),score=20.23 TRINITY_DN23912_c0_g1_i1:162-623(-)